MPMSGKVTLSIGLIGPGLVGSALLSQLQRHAASLEAYGTFLRVVGVTNSRVAISAPSETGLDLSTWQQDLTERGQPMDLSAFQESVASSDGHSVLVDCTASEAVPQQYAKWLSSGKVHIVTPNKKLGSGPLPDYNLVKDLQQQHGSRFFYEATVGAGLPIISTLQGLLRTGDQVERIEGIFSGTLSYIFNTFGSQQPFSQVVVQAKEAGYTEPDPRDDLSGMDVARKVVILARECGLQVELADVEVESLVPEPLQSATTADEFLIGLPQFDAAMEERAKAAEAEGKRLCYVGLVDVAASKCSVALKAYSQTHAFAQLSGSDNIIGFTSVRYRAQPLFVRGPGAGAEVTAAGVFSDLILLARSLGARC